MRTSLITFLACCFAVSLVANVGDTPAQIEASYGKPVEIYRDVKGRMSYIHHIGEYAVVVQYLAGISQSELFYRKDDGVLTEAVMQKFRKSNSGGQVWQEIPADVLIKMRGPGWRVWVTEARSISAYGPAEINDRQYHHVISVGTRAYNEENKRLSQQ